MSPKRSPSSSSCRARTFRSPAVAPSSGRCCKMTSSTSSGSWSIRSSWAAGSACLRTGAIRRRWSSWIQRPSARASSISPINQCRTKPLEGRGVFAPALSLLLAFIHQRPRRRVLGNPPSPLVASEGCSDVPRIPDEEAFAFVLHLDTGGSHPLAHRLDLLRVVEHHRPVAKPNPALRNGRYALATPDVETEVVMVAAGG